MHCTFSSPAALCYSQHPLHVLLLFSTCDKKGDSRILSLLLLASAPTRSPSLSWQATAAGMGMGTAGRRPLRRRARAIRRWQCRRSRTARVTTMKMNTATERRMALLDQANDAEIELSCPARTANRGGWNRPISIDSFWMESSSISRSAPSFNRKIKWHACIVLQSNQAMLMCGRKLSADTLRSLHSKRSGQ